MKLFFFLVLKLLRPVIHSPLSVSVCVCVRLCEIVDLFAGVGIGYERRIKSIRTTTKRQPPTSTPDQPTHIYPYLFICI